MVVPLLFALIGHSFLTPLQRVSGSLEWEEQAIIQKLPGYHPMLRFEAPFEMLGFNQTSRFMFATPNFVAEGHYSVRDGHYYFHPVAAMLIGNREVNMLLADKDPGTQRKLHKAYADSLDDFEADYNQRTGILFLTYRVDGLMKTFQLLKYSEPDNYVSRFATDSERSLIGLWGAPEPFPEKLDCQTRYKIGGLEGLEQFTKEASASEAAVFALLDLRGDKSFRLHGKIGTWSRNGSTLTLREGKDETRFTISSDNSKLQLGGKTAFARN